MTSPAADARACGLTGCLERLAATYAQHAVDAGADGQRGAATAYRVVMADLERLVTEHAALCALTFPGGDLRAVLEHAQAALAHDNEGVRLWMLDCGNLVQRHRERAETAEARLAEVHSVLLEGGQDAATARRKAIGILGRVVSAPGASDPGRDRSREPEQAGQ